MNSIYNYLELVVAGMAVGYLVNALPGYLRDLATKELEQILQRGDPADDDLAIAVVRWIEAKIDLKGAGETKFKLAADKIVALCPWLKGQNDKIEKIIENSVAKMQAEVDSQIQKHQTPQ